MDSNTVRIVCVTSNEYHNCLVPFMHYFNRFGGADRFVTIAGYDAPSPDDLPANCEFISIGKQADYTWSSGLLKLLQMTDDELILLLLDDYFMTAPVDWARIDELAWWMNEAFDVGKIDLSGDRLKTPHQIIGADLVLSDGDAPFQTSLQAAIWRPSFLYQYLDETENAWQFEKNGTKRLMAWRQYTEVHRYVAGTRCPAMQYANAVGGAGGKPGVIEAKHMPSWMWDECVAKGWAS